MLRPVGPGSAKIPGGVFHRGPMRLGNPFALITHGSDGQAADLAGVVGPLRAVVVLVENGLHFIAEAPLARLC